MPCFIPRATVVVPSLLVLVPLVESYKARSRFIATKGTSFERARNTVSALETNKELSFLARDGSQQRPVIETTSKTWFSKMGDAFMIAIFGCLLIIFSIPIMWVNERQNARQESLIKLGMAECRRVDASTAVPHNRGTLVHVHGATARSMKSVQDQRFACVKFDENCLRLKSTVQAYQWKEQSATTEKKDSLGGGSTKETTYTYTKDWADTLISSGSFKDRSHVNSMAIDGLVLGTEIKTCERVEYGEGFVLPSSLVGQLTDFKSTVALLGKNVTFGQFNFEAVGDFFYYSISPEEPNIGDIRVKFEYIPDGPMTVMALQSSSADTDEPRDTFLPYRMISRGLLCSIEESEQKARLIAEGYKNTDSLYQEDACDCGPLNLIFCCCLCVCNLVNYCFSGLLPPQVYKIFEGDKDVEVCWKEIQTQAQLFKWIMRFVGWLMMFAGTYSLFQPIFTAFDLIPFLGPYFGTFAGYVIYALCVIVTIAISSLIVSVAYLIYHPLTGLIYLIFVGLCTAVPMAISATFTATRH